MLWSATDTAEALLINAMIAMCALMLFSITRPDRAFDRAMLGVIGIALLMNYIHWRIDHALPDIIMGPAFAWQATFLGFEILTVVCGLSSFTIMMAVTDRSAEADAAAPRFAARGEWPAVDILICTYNEPEIIVGRAILCARAVDYPNATVWVCDDSRREWLRALCEELGVEYVTRPDNTGAKAGNLNNALAHTAGRSNAPFLLVLDADFCIRPELIRRVLPLFEDETIGLVQTPQYFYNPDPIQHNLGARRTLCDDQRSFFDILQPSKDAANAAFCVGTSFIVRREAVTRAGGFPDGAICEDLNLSYQLYRAGYITRWLNERLSVGISAESVPEYLTQRTRWCLGTIQVGLLPDGPIFGSGYSLTLRMHYVQNLLCWMCKPFIMLVLIAPAVFMWTGVPVYDTELAPFLAAGLPCFIHLWAHGIWVSNGRGLPILTEVVQAVTAIAVTRSVATGLTHPFGKPFKVTAKGVDRSQARVHWPLVRVFGAIIAVTLCGMAYTILSPDAPSAHDALSRFNFVWAGFALLVCTLCIVALVDRPRPAEELFDLEEPAEAEHADGRLASTTVRQASTRHAVVSGAQAPVALHFEGVGRVAVSASEPHGRDTLLTLSPGRDAARALTVKLYAGHRSGVADTGRLLATLRSAARSARAAGPAH